MSARLRFGIGLLVSGALVVLLLRAVPANRVVEVARSLRPGPVLAVVVAHALMLLLRIRRYQLVVEEVPTRAGWWACFDAVFVGWLANLALPAKVGELARPAALARTTGRPFAEVLGTVATERVLDLLALGVGFWLAFAALPGASGLPPWFARFATVGGVASVMGVMGFAALRRFGPQGAGGSSLRRALVRFRDGLALFARPRQLARVLGFTALVWIAETGVAVLTLAACGVAQPFSLPGIAAATARSVVATLAVALPAAPGGIGVDQWASVLALRPFGVPDALATAASLLDLGVALLIVVPMGTLAMGRLGPR